MADEKCPKCKGTWAVKDDPDHECDPKLVKLEESRAKAAEKAADKADDTTSRTTTTQTKSTTTRSSH